jgi:hypothetical protein
MPNSQVVREALRLYGEQLGGLSEEERVRLLEPIPGLRLHD